MCRGGVECWNHTARQEGSPVRPRRYPANEDERKACALCPMRLHRRPLESFREPSGRRCKRVATIPETPRADDPPIAATAAPTRRGARRSPAPPLPPPDRGRLLLLTKVCRGTPRPNPVD